MMRKGPLAASPEEYVQSIDGWQRTRVDMLREIALGVGDSDETVKWGHLVYMANGPAFLIRAEDHRVLFGFWRGKRLLGIEPRMTGTGKYEMKTLDLREDTQIDPAVAEQLIREAIRLNRTVGNPTART
ncbi:DUF1801 domain-containing protein [Sphingomonas sp. NSE70-1]|uniref:DUF1801 domain-containing protein n=1 Tax=Sphingomonas caseinilyticus TaxID=2908205 RepID=A0ABT0RSU0_9SPHN|nr:DUF1801 domain-containing protein [Sphingomonas caseinilyticus]MCL6698074.1 DUF1801 domain-containing protein [Sphingomonas caseinilyticus]